MTRTSRLPCGVVPGPVTLPVRRLRPPVIPSSATWPATRRPRDVVADLAAQLRPRRDRPHVRRRRPGPWRAVTAPAHHMGHRPQPVLDPPRPTGHLACRVPVEGRDAGNTKPRRQGTRTSRTLHAHPHPGPAAGNRLTSARRADQGNPPAGARLRPRYPVKPTTAPRGRAGGRHPTSRGHRPPTATSPTMTHHNQQAGTCS